MIILSQRMQWSVPNTNKVKRSEVPVLNYKRWKRHDIIATTVFVKRYVQYIVCTGEKIMSPMAQLVSASVLYNKGSGSIPSRVNPFGHSPIYLGKLKGPGSRPGGRMYFLLGLVLFYFRLHFACSLRKIPIHLL